MVYTVYSTTFQHTTLSRPHTCSDGLVCDEPSCEVISVSLHMSIIIQDGDSPLMAAVKEGMTEVVSLLVKAGATLDPSWNKASKLLKSI